MPARLLSSVRWCGEAGRYVIPAKAGIHRLGQALDTHFRGHDMGWINWDSNELSDGIAAGETDSVGAVVDYAAVIPAQAGIHGHGQPCWMHAFAGMTRDSVR